MIYFFSLLQILYFLQKNCVILLSKLMKKVHTCGFVENLLRNRNQIQNQTNI